MPGSSEGGGAAKVLLVGGSPSDPSRSSRVLTIVQRDLEAAGLTTDLLNLRELPSEELVFARSDDPGPVRQSVERLAAADGVVLGSPIYKASIAGLMKLWLDLLPQFALKGKVVLPLATGASLTSVLAIDYGIRPILNSMGTTHVLPGFFVLDKWIETGDDGLDRLAARPQAMLDPIVSAFIDAVRR